jgi:mannose 2-epimerase
MINLSKKSTYFNSTANMNKTEIKKFRDEAYQHLTTELLPFWTSRMKDETNGGYITHFDKNGNDTGDDEKSLIAQTRCLYTISSAHRAGYGNGELADLAKHGADFLLNKMWDNDSGGFYWMMDRKGNVKIDKKILYGLSFAIYSLSEYTLATGDSRGVEYAKKTFDLVQKYCADTYYGGYFEMFSPRLGTCRSRLTGRRPQNPRRAHAPDGSLHFAF